jgi:hypothetical protein
MDQICTAMDGACEIWSPDKRHLVPGHALLEARDVDSSELLEVLDLKTTWGDLTDASGS